MKKTTVTNLQKKKIDDANSEKLSSQNIHDTKSDVYPAKMAVWIAIAFLLEAQIVLKTSLVQRLPPEGHYLFERAIMV